MFNRLRKINIWHVGNSRFLRGRSAQNCSTPFTLFSYVNPANLLWSNGNADCSSRHFLFGKIPERPAFRSPLVEPLKKFLALDRIIWRRSRRRLDCFTWWPQFCALHRKFCPLHPTPEDARSYLFALLGVVLPAVIELQIQIMLRIRRLQFLNQIVQVCCC